MKVTPPGGFTLGYFQNICKGTLPKESTHERIETSDVFRETHRGPRVLTTKSEWIYVWNAITCTCCTLFSDEEDIHTCENVAIIENVKKAKERNQPYDLVFIAYKKESHNNIDKLIADIRSVSPETKVFLLTFFEDQIAEDLKKRGYFSMSGDELIEQTTYDSLIAGALGDEGIRRLEKN